MNLKKSIAIFSSAVLLVPTVGTGIAQPQSVSAEETIAETQDREYYENLGYQVYEFENHEGLENHIDTENFDEIRSGNGSVVQPMGFISGSVVFVGGVAVGYVVDGVVINMSGQSVGEWVSDGIDGVINWF